MKMTNILKELEEATKDIKINHTQVGKTEENKDAKKKPRRR